ncbi:MAG TPA: hypothetical protein VEK57_13920 [Thermoanaerobaculia bacterium]|nr:hypothetical protein [Thermoanaerobaculia bacterium]
MKRYGILLLVVAIALASAPAAMAKCQRCKPAILACGDATIGGWEYCEWTWDNNCIVHTPCGTLAAAAPSESLAAEFIVAAVERLDEPQIAASETPAVASLETPAPVTNR